MECKNITGIIYFGLGFIQCHVFRNAYQKDTKITKFGIKCRNRGRIMNYG